MTTSSDRLYELLPAIYRLRDQDRGQVLRALLALLDGEFSAVESDIAGLLRNWFVETCDEWVVPYIGDLLGVRGLNPIRTIAFSQRAYVANTLRYRRRKGTASVLGDLAGDVTGWPAHVVEFFERLQTTQYMNHIRLSNTMPDLRQVDALNLLEGPFDSLAHTADVRHINNRRGKHNIANIGVFLWRLQNYPMQDATARRAEAPNAHGYHTSPLGHPAPLFGCPGGAGSPEEQQVPAPIRPLDFHLDLEAYQAKYGTVADPPEVTRYYGEGFSLHILKDGASVSPKQIMCKNLRDWTRPPAGKVAVDVARGRIAFAVGEEPASGVTVSYSYGFSADMGGGPYDRRDRITDIQPPLQEFAVGADKVYAVLSDAVTGWESAGKPPAVIRIYDSATYDAGLTIHLPDNGMLVLDCENGERPTLLHAEPLHIISDAASAETTAALTLSGLCIGGSLEVSGRIDLQLADCTLVPGRALDEDGYPEHPDQPSLTVGGTGVEDTTVSLSRSILGPLELPAECRGLTIRDCIIDAPLAKDATEPSRAAIAADAVAAEPGPVTILERVTVFGKVNVRQLDLASEVIFTHSVRTERRQTGCVRFCSIAEGSRTPRRFRCQPDLAVAKRKTELDVNALPLEEVQQVLRQMRPRFTSRRFGEAAFAQLSSSCAEEIRTGAEDGSEMGAFQMLQQPQRLANLKIALDEYLRFGLEAGIFFVT
jgi:hypothetical protein